VPFALHCIIGIGEALSYCHNGLVPSGDDGRYERVESALIGLVHQDIKAEDIFLRTPLD